jgi:hypothetical protein
VIDTDRWLAAVIVVTHSPSLASCHTLIRVRSRCVASHCSGGDVLVALRSPPRIAGVPAARRHISSTNRRVKTESSRRTIPVHYGLTRFVEWAEKQGSGPLFPHLKQNSKGQVSSGPSNWFGRLKSKVLVKDKNRKVFHSFRNTMVERFKAEFKS